MSGNTVVTASKIGVPVGMVFELLDMHLVNSPLPNSLYISAPHINLYPKCSAHFCDVLLFFYGGNPETCSKSACRWKK